MEVLNPEKVVENSESIQVATVATFASPRPSADVSEERALSRSSFGLAFTDSEFLALQENLKRQRKNRRRGENGGMKLFPWLRIDGHISGRELEGSIQTIHQKLGEHQGKARRVRADPELDGYIFSFFADLGIASRLADRYPGIYLKSFTIISEKLSLHKNAIISLLDNKVEAKRRDRVFALLCQHSVELEETVAHVRQHVQRIFGGSSAIDDSDDTDSDISDSDSDEDESEIHDGFSWLAALGSEEERIGN